MLNNINKTDFFYDYYSQWITVYKEGAIRKVTMDKYLLTQSWIKRLAPDLKVCELNRISYQKLLNDYAKEHERQTTMDFHHQLKGAILDAVDEGNKVIEAFEKCSNRSLFPDSRWYRIIKSISSPDSFHYSWRRPVRKPSSMAALQSLSIPAAASAADSSPRSSFCI